MMLGTGAEKRIAEEKQLPLSLRDLTVLTENV